MIRSYQGLFWYWGSTAPGPAPATGLGTRYRMGSRINFIKRVIIIMVGI
jgi:hypothetical protein